MADVTFLHSLLLPSASPVIVYEVVKKAAGKGGFTRLQGEGQPKQLGASEEEAR